MSFIVQTMTACVKKIKKEIQLAEFVLVEKNQVFSCSQLTIGVQPQLRVMDYFLQCEKLF